MERYLRSTKLLDYSNSAITSLIIERKWQGLDEYHKIQGIYNYVRDEVAFGYNNDDAICASEVLKEGYGQCNTKGILFMALLRAVGIPCRIHGFIVDKKMQKGTIKGIYFYLAPTEIVHTWVEIYYENKWYNLEGVILDKEYLGKLQSKFKYCKDGFCGYGVATDSFANPQIEWEGNHTYIQSKGIVKELGVYDSPDEFFAVHKQNLGAVKRFIYQKLIRKLMNRNVAKIREEI